jgi:lipoprotein-releasing system ATP-binding protein
VDVIAKDLTMQFNDAGKCITIFSDLSLSIESGKSLAVVGRSGVGKTTLLNILGALEAPVKGDVVLGEESLSQLAKKPAELTRFRGRRIGFVFQSHYLLPEFDAEENVAMPLLVSGVRPKQAFSSARSLLDKVGLSDRYTHRPGMLSGGEQQRVAIARSLVADPGLVLADEPTGSLDRETGEEVGNLLLSMQQERQFTLVVVTHSRELAGKLDNVVELTPKGIDKGNLE